jgi:hypothetical protein
MNSTFYSFGVLGKNTLSEGKTNPFDKDHFIATKEDLVSTTKELLTPAQEIIQAIMKKKNTSEHEAKLYAIENGLI